MSEVFPRNESRGRYEKNHGNIGANAAVSKRQRNEGANERDGASNGEAGGGGVGGIRSSLVQRGIRV